MEIYKGINYFYIGSEEEPLAILDFRVKYNTLFIESLTISPQLKGQGIGADLTEAAVNFAKERGYNIESKYIICK